ncbi:type I-C CRISPR-associated protein Cas8c/Csd1 [Alysiella filiformis]|uniref:CRISPR-associated protein Csd1 n=1 Tax=Alysiella filiformis DSM 16848 TaxID=1120981 RepID=A0A286ECS0_9NEIS|nr:type I-C CRISPR-associated protein Cas8c/Csd1 [Alysiella filiformis]QMT30552.1 type I-C CRISPR-associated protein Cas8c/Csd1 [Alysiella filiformis]UBQ56468.1 type I-C CRISPR-associated protein Cas8c/Csd1 [Alysiella filiformis DSM 16848]SOD68624.1 CRISPR-associated protein Csd1 [Alysiella filiformis DSM 16848]
MTWIQKLYHTYEAVSCQNLDSTTPLTPIGHTIQTAHIVIVIDGQGTFITARVMPPKTTIMLPATESSENRTSGEAPHPLADKLQYVAKDYLNYGGGKKAYFDGYLKQLTAWCESSSAHPKVKAILNYVQKGTVIQDLIKVGVLPVNEHNQVLSQWEQEGEAPEIFSVLPKTKGEIEFGSALVCWSVEMAGDPNSNTWTDSSIQQAWTNYLAQTDGEQGFCFVKGEETTISTMHPAKLRHTGDKAKLISSNDKEGYTYRGRFDTAEEAASVSAEVSAKAHGALRWLIGRQGIKNGEQVTVAWAIGGQKVPSPLADMFFDVHADTHEDTPNETPQSENLKDWSADMGEQAAVLIKKKLHGYQAKLDKHEQISLLMLDSATTGRIALTYYQEFLPQTYFANLDAWIDDLTWYQRYSTEKPDAKKSDKKQKIWAKTAPSPFAIAQAVYGKSLSDTLKKQLYARLLPVIAGGRSVPIPYDWVKNSFQAACNPSSHDSIWEWQRNIGVACALYKGWRARHHDLLQRRTYTMSLDTENRSRDYVFGRLLAIAEHIERMALNMTNEMRATNAERYMQRFVNSPFKTWQQLEINLKPYKERLRKDYPVRISEKFTLQNPLAFLNNKNNEISQLLAILDELHQSGCDLNQPLEPEFLLGYHSQRMANRQSKQPESNTPDNPIQQA